MFRSPSSICLLDVRLKRTIVNLSIFVHYYCVFLCTLHGVQQDTQNDVVGLTQE